MIDQFGFDDLGRPCKDLYFMNLSFHVASRSLDPSTKCGCIAVDEDGFILATGYNSPPIGSIDQNIPTTRPEKYSFYEHSERNCIYCAARHGTSLKNATFYITGRPCMDCLRGMIQVGAKRIVYGPNTAKMSTEKDWEMYTLMLTGMNISFEEFKYDNSLIDLGDITREKIKDIIYGKQRTD